MEGEQKFDINKLNLYIMSLENERWNEARWYDGGHYPDWTGNFFFSTKFENFPFSNVYDGQFNRNYRH